VAKPHEIDYDAFLARLVAALRKAWQQVLSQRPGETFYLFGIETDSDITDLYPLCNTEEQYAADEGSHKPSSDKWTMDDDSTLYRAGKKHTLALAQEVNRYVFEDHSNDPPGAFLDRKRRLLHVFEKALVRLDEEEFFGAGKTRNKVLLQIAFVDPSDAERTYTLKVIKRINPRESTADFFAALKAQEREEAVREGEKRREEGPIKALAIEFLRREKRSFESCFDVSRNQTVTPFLLNILGEKTPPDEFWEVCFDAKNEPSGRSHGPGVLIVYVIPASGKCVIAP
jgi:hypothetical protein